MYKIQLNMDGIQYKKMLAELAKQIRPSEVSAMKFMCADIPKRRQEEITTCFQLWEALEERDHLAPDNVSFLRDILQTCTDNRTDLLNILQSYQTGAVSTRNNGTISVNHGLDKEFEYVADNIGRDWRRLARKLGLTETDIEAIVEAHNRNLREQVRQSLQTWQEKNREKATRNLLIKALRSAQFVLIADDLELKE